MPGRFASESVADFKRNQWPIWRGIGGRFGAESPLIRRGYTVSTGKFDDLEVDFVANRNNEILYIQVTYLLASKEVEEREFKPLERIKVLS